MKIKSIAISNIHSFENHEDLMVAPELEFNIQGTEGSLHIMIGPNGAGKSNFIDVITQIFQKAFLITSQINEILFRQKTRLLAQQLRDILREDPPQGNTGLTSNRYTDSLEMKILIVLELNENDFSNLNHLVIKTPELNQVLATYSHSGVRLRTDVNITSIKSQKTVKILLSGTQADRFTISLPDGQTPERTFILDYLQHFNLFKNAVDILDREQEESSGVPRSRINSLKHTFSLIGSYRNYNAFSGHFIVQDNRSEPEKNILHRLRQETTRHNDNSEPAVFELVKMKIGYRFVELMREKGEALAKEAIQQEEPFKSIYKYIQRYLRLKLEIEFPNTYSLNISLTLKDEQGRIVSTEQLSSGEKGILHFIFSLYGYDLMNGVMIIDEPELHLHPQMQSHYFKIIKEVKRDFDIQFIIATHSPQFVNKDTIADVLRFYLDDQRHTKIIKPVITEDQKNLVQFLTYTNSAKIFFVNKVILVEGETDEYFFKFYLDWIKDYGDPALYPWKERIEDFEILYVGGKSAFEKWIDFLNKFKIQAYTIADLDKIENGKSSDQLLVLKTTDPIRWAEIQAEITRKYTDNFFILKEGTLENYLGITKGLDKVIEFCESQFESWRTDSTYVPYKSEFDQILSLIFT